MVEGGLAVRGARAGCMTFFRVVDDDGICVAGDASGVPIWLIGRPDETGYKCWLRTPGPRIGHEGLDEVW